MGVRVSFVLTKTDRDAMFAYASKQLQKRIQKGWIYKAVSWACGIGLGLFLIMLFDLRKDVLDFATHTYTWAVGSIALFLVAGATLIRMGQNRAKQIAVALPAGAEGEISVTLELDESGMNVIDPYFQGLLKWESIFGVGEDKRYLFVELMSLRYAGVPKSAFSSPEDLAEFQGYIQARAGKMGKSRESLPGTAACFGE